MKRSIQKLISFLSAAAMFCNLPMLGAGAAYTAEQIGTEFGAVYRCKDYSMFIENGNADGSFGETKMIIMYDDGVQRAVTLEKDICSLSPYCSTTMGTYNFLSPSPAAYSFDFYDPAFQIGSDQQVMIIEPKKGKYALGDMDGKLVSDFHELLLYMGEGYYEFADNDSSGGVSVGVVSADGTEVLTASTGIERAYLSQDGKSFLVQTKDGDYFTDLNGKRISDVYARIDCAEVYNDQKTDYYYWSGYAEDERPVFRPGTMKVRDWSKMESTRLESKYYRFYNESGQYAASFGDIKPETDYYNVCEMRSREVTDPVTDQVSIVKYICLAESYGYNAPATCYDLDGNLLESEPESSSYTQTSSRDYTYFSVFTHELRDADGNTLITMPEECKDAYRYTMNDKTYYVGITDSEFMVLDSEGTILQNHMEGVPENSIFYYTKEEASKNKYEEKRVSGFFTPEKGIVTTPDYENVILWDNSDTNNEGSLIACRKDGKLEFYDITGEKRREFYTDYQFEYAYNNPNNSPLCDLHCLLLNGKDPETGKAFSVVYNALEDKILYEVEGSNRRITDAYKDYIVVSEYESDDAALQTDQNIISQALYRMDGTELIAPTSGIFISLKKLDDRPEYCESYPLEYAYFRKAEKDTDKCFAVLSQRNLKEADDAYQEAFHNHYMKFEGVYIDPDNLDSQYGAYQAAVKLEDGRHAVFHDGKWMLADSGGKAYDLIFFYQNGLAACADFENREYTGYSYDPSTHVEVPATLTLPMANKGVTDRCGRELVKPLADTDVASTEGTIYVRQPMESNNMQYKYINLRTDDVFNPFTEQYGYDTAIACDDLYVVSKDGLVGIVTTDNQEILPVKYEQVLYFTADQFSLASIKAPLSEILSGEQLTSPVRKLGDGTKLVSMKTTEGKVEAFRLSLSDTEQSVGDVNGDGIINSKDATMVLIAAAKQGTGRETELTASQQKAADVNGDGKINASDATVILRYAAAAGIGTKAPITDYI